MKKIVFCLLISPILFSQKKWSLEECINYSMEKNLSIKQIELSKKSQEETIKVNQFQKYPSVNGNFGGNYSIGFQNNLEGTTEIAQSFSNNYSIGSNAILYNNGTIRLNLEKSKLDLQAIDWISEKAKNDLTLQITQNYFTILLNYELKTVAEKNREISDQNRIKSEKLFNAGKIPIGELYQVKSNLANDNQVFENAKINIQRAKFNLSQLLQLDDYRDFEVEIIAAPQTIEEELYDIDQILNFAYENQPKIKEIFTKIESSKLDLKTAKNALFPTVSGNYSFGTSYFDFFNRKNPSYSEQWWKNQNHQFGLSISVPIYSKYQNKARIEQAKIAIENQNLTLEQEKIALKQTIQLAYFDVSATMENYKAQIQSVESSKKALEYAKKSFDAGLTSIFDYTISRNNNLIAESQMLQTKYDLLFKRKVLGFYKGEKITF